MTGCFGSEDVEVTIMSSHAPGSTGFVWTKEGEIHAVDIDHEVCSMYTLDHQCYQKERFFCIEN